MEVVEASAVVPSAAGGAGGPASMDVSGSVGNVANGGGSQRIMTVEEMAALNAMQAMEADAELELKQLDEMALRLGLCEDHVLELDYTFRVWDNDCDGYISAEDIKAVLINLAPDIPIEEQSDVATLFKLAEIVYHPSARLNRARFIKVCLKVIQFGFCFVDGLELRVLPMAIEREKLTFHRKLIKMVTLGRRMSKFPDEFGLPQQKAITLSKTLLKEFNSIRQMLRSSDHLEKGLEHLGQMLSVYSVCHSYYDRQLVADLYKIVFNEKSGIPWTIVYDRMFSVSSQRYQYLCLQILVHIAKMIYAPQSRLLHSGFDKLFTQLCPNVLSKIAKNKNSHEVVKAHALHLLGICSVRDGVCIAMLRGGVIAEIIAVWNTLQGKSDEGIVLLLEAISLYCSSASKNPTLKEFVIPILPKLCQQVIARSSPDVMFLSALCLRHLLPQQTLRFDFVESLIETLFSTTDSKIAQVLAGCVELCLFEAKIKFPEAIKDKESARLLLLQKISSNFGTNKEALSHCSDLLRRLFEEEDSEGEQMNDVEAAARGFSQLTKIATIIVEKTSIIMPHDFRCRRLLRYLCIKRTHILEDLIPDLIYSLASYFAHAVQSNAVLRQVYQHVRMELNVSMSSDIYDSLDGIFSFILQKEDSSLILERLNPGFITHIETFIPAVSANSEIMGAFQSLLFKIRDIFTQRLSRTSEIALQKLDIVMASYFESKPAQVFSHSGPRIFSTAENFVMPANPLRLMLAYKNAIEIEQMGSASITYDNLMSSIRQKYGKDLIPKYNYQGTLVAIENQVSLDRAISHSNREVLRLELFDSHHSNDFSVPQSLHNDGYIGHMGKRYKVDITVLKQLRTQWLEITPNNYMTRDLFMVSLGSGSASQDPAFAELLFSGMDSAKIGGINFESYVQAWSILQGKNYQSRLHLLFTALDRDGDGFVSLRDLENIVLLFQNMGGSPAVQHYLDAMNYFFSQTQTGFQDLNFRQFHILVLRRILPLPFEDLFRRVPTATPRTGKKPQKPGKKGKDFAADDSKEDYQNE